MDRERDSAKNRSKLELLMDEKRRELNDLRGIDPASLSTPTDSGPSSLPPGPQYTVQSSDQIRDDKPVIRRSTRIEIPANLIDSEISRAMEAIAPAQEFRKNFERELEVTRGNLGGRVVELKETLAGAQEEIRARDEQIRLLLSKLHRHESDGQIENQNLKEQMDRATAGFKQTVEQYKDLYRTCEGELLNTKTIVRELESKVTELRRQIQDQSSTLKSYMELYQNSETQFLESEKKRMELSRQIQENDAKLKSIEKEQISREKIEETADQLQEIVASIESFFDFASHRGATPQAFKAGRLLSDQLSREVEKLYTAVGKKTFPKA